MASKVSRGSLKRTSRDLESGDVCPKLQVKSFSAENPAGEVTYTAAMSPTEETNMMIALNACKLVKHVQENREVQQTRNTAKRHGPISRSNSCSKLLVKKSKERLNRTRVQSICEHTSVHGIRRNSNPSTVEDVSGVKTREKVISGKTDFHAQSSGESRLEGKGCLKETPSADPHSEIPQDVSDEAKLSLPVKLCTDSRAVVDLL